MRRWAADGVGRLTCEDLSKPGWRHDPDNPLAGRAVIGGAAVAVSEIAGVVVRRPWVFAEELPHVAAQDRDYVAAEMSAFLVAWLAVLPCAVFNPPSAACLSGPGWDAWRWNHAAAAAGIRVRPMTSRIPEGGATPPSGLPGAEAGAKVTVIDGRVFGSGNGRVNEAARRLATTAGVRSLSARFDIENEEPIFLAASAFPDLEDQAASDWTRERMIAARP